MTSIVQVSYNQFWKEYVATLPDGQEFFGATASEARSFANEALRVMSDHARKGGDCAHVVDWQVCENCQPAYVDLAEVF